MVYRTLRFKASVVHIGLFSVPLEDTEMFWKQKYYDIVLCDENNSQLFIWDSSTEEKIALTEATVTEATVCDPDEWRTITVGQKDSGSVFVSKGDTPNSIFMEY